MSTPQTTAPAELTIDQMIAEGITRLRARVETLRQIGQDDVAAELDSMATDIESEEIPEDRREIAHVFSALSGITLADRA